MKCAKCGGEKFVHKGPYLKPGNRGDRPAGMYHIMKCCKCGKTAIGERIETEAKAKKILDIYLEDPVTEKRLITAKRGV